MAGKGSKERPISDRSRFNDNMDTIFRKKLWGVYFVGDDTFIGNVTASSEWLAIRHAIRILKCNEEEITVKEL